MEQKHSALGIAGFVISIVAGVLMFVIIGVAGALEIKTPGGIDENSTTAMLVGLAIIAVGTVDVVAVAFAIAGLMQSDRKKVLSVLGLVFSISTIVGTALLVVAGNQM